MKPAKHQRSKQRCQDLYWKVHDRAQSFVLRSYTMHDSVTKTVVLVSSSVRSKQLLSFVYGQGQKNEEKHTTKNFDGFHIHSSLLKKFFFQRCQKFLKRRLDYRFDLCPVKYKKARCISRSRRR